MSNELARMAQMQDGLSKILARVNDYDVVDGMFSPSCAQNLCTRSFLIIFIILLPRTKKIWDL